MLENTNNRWEELMFLSSGLYILFGIVIIATFVAEPKEVGIVLEDEIVQTQ